jgi:tetratricopeptide (TPR) repeat protein
MPPSNRPGRGLSLPSCAATAALAVTLVSANLAAQDPAGLTLPAAMRLVAGLRRQGDFQLERQRWQALLSMPAASRSAELRAYLINHLADTDIELGAYPEAEREAREAMAILREARQTWSSMFAVAERTLADALCAQGKLEQARVLAENAVELGKQVLDSQSPNLAILLTSLGQVMKDMGKLGRAEQLCLRAAEIFETTGGDAIDLGSTFSDLAVISIQRGDPKRAFIRINRALAAWNGVLPPDHPFVVYALDNQVVIYTKLRAFREGEALIPKLLALGETRFGRDHPERAVLLNNAAALYEAEKDYDQAEPLLREAAEVTRRRLPAGNSIRSDVLLNYAGVLRRLHRPEEAARARAEGELIRVQSSGNALVGSPVVEVRP